MPTIIKHQPLKEMTWIKVGGSADYFVDVSTREDLRKAFSFAHEKKLPVIYLGQGSNMIIPDEGFRALVLRLKNDHVEYDLDFSRTHALLTVEGGKILSKLIHECRKKGLKGLDNFIGIPGVVGAAVRGNIGIPAEEFGELVSAVEIFDGKQFRRLEPQQCSFFYRGSRIKDQYSLVWAVQLRIKKGEPPKKDLWLLERITKQPKGHSCGSFFKNPNPEAGLFAGQLIEECELKGRRVGGAVISEQHGNFLMNEGTATAADIIALARLVKQEVFARKGIVLENEVLVYDQWGRLVQL